ncbi:MAG: HD-GYP domain-containing protein [Thermoguttaceae bacterium]
MLRVPTDKLQPGMVLARPIPMPQNPSRYLLQRGREIPAEAAARLKRMGITEVWVRHRDLEFLEDVIEEELGDCQQDLYVRIRRVFDQMRRTGRAQLEQAGLEQSIAALANFLRRGCGKQIMLQKLDAFDDYLTSHSVNVCYLALLLGLKLGQYLMAERRFRSARDAKDLPLLGLGALLHDIGKLLVPEDILNKPGSLSPEETAEVRRHPIYGYKMVKSRLPPSASQIVLNHHQRWDGTGYPSRIDRHTGREFPPLAGKQIPVFSRIAILADVYDAATSQRCYADAKPPVQALYEMHHLCQGFFDPVIKAVFFRTVPPFPIGQVVTLSNGMEAVVLDFNPDCPMRPKVRCLRTPTGQPLDRPWVDEIDLSLQAELEIVRVDRVEVRPFTGIEQQAGPLVGMT